MSTNSALVVAFRLLRNVGIDGDIWEDLDVGKAVVDIVQDLLVKLIKDLQNLLGRVTLAALSDKPSRKEILLRGDFHARRETRSTK